MPDERPIYPCPECGSVATQHRLHCKSRPQMSDRAPTYVKCRVCDCAMNAKYAAAHLDLHVEAGDLIRAAHRQELAEMGERDV